MSALPPPSAALIAPTIDAMRKLAAAHGIALGTRLPPPTEAGLDRLAHVLSRMPTRNSNDFERRHFKELQELLH